MSTTEPTPITVKRLIDPEQLKKDMRFSLADLSSAMMEQAPLSTHYGMLAAKASRQVNDLELLLEVTEAKVYRIARDKRDAETEKDKKVTEAALAKIVSTNAQVVSIRKALNEAKQIEAQTKTAVEAFRQRRDMLIQSGLISREEMKGEISIARRNELEAIRDDQRRDMARKITSAASK